MLFLAYLGAKVWRKEERKREVHTEGQCNLPTAVPGGSEDTGRVCYRSTVSGELWVAVRLQN